MDIYSSTPFHSLHPPQTEIARRIAKLSQAPFIKVEATKFTEVGFHGKDVDQIIRDLVDISINMTKKKLKEVSGVFRGVYVFAPVVLCRNTERDSCCVNSALLTLSSTCKADCAPLCVFLYVLFPLLQQVKGAAAVAAEERILASLVGEFSRMCPLCVVCALSAFAPAFDTSDILSAAVSLHLMRNQATSFLSFLCV
jgi:hypothetical protein